MKAVSIVVRFFARYAVNFDASGLNSRFHCMCGLHLNYTHFLTETGSNWRQKEFC